jgi:4-hydroxybenzoate polyprenyltransferase
VTQSLSGLRITFILLRLLNSVVSSVGHWTMGALPDTIICIWTMATIHLQDFRDIEGDYKTHAITIPIILSSEGRMKLRKATAFALLTGVVLSGLWICIRGQHASAMLTGLVFYLSSGVLDFYTVISRSRHQDRIVYRWWMVTGLCVIVLFLSCSCWRRRHFDGIGHRKRLRLSKINLPANEIPRDKLS